ncbi:beta-lactamase/transpeptidase-like protein [Aspergillus pseudoustus]|uniref:Beta-lactamase/transpeptidase-like protein n=1 Tax=Aspergillus pseudoustus TaxID=1810923 RepID=A0ABR4II70_9EURO
MSETIESAHAAAIAAGKITGGIICATNTTGTFTYKTAIGTRTTLSGITLPLETGNILFLASATKFLATIAALQCVEDGLLSLTGDLSPHAPELTSKRVLTGFATESGGEPLLEDPIRPITLEMLLTHSSGLSYHFIDPNIARWRAESSPDRDTARGLAVEDLFNYPLAFHPGSSWMYGPGLDWAGRIVERVTGQTLLARMQERIFDPLGISDAQFYPVTREDLRERLIDLNPDDPQALGKAVLGGGGEMNLRTRGDFGGHGLFMSGESFLRVLQSVLANDGVLLKTETVDDMFSDHHLSPGASGGHQAALQSPMGQFFRVGVDPETKMGHGLGGLLTLEAVEGWYGKHTLTWGGGMTLAWFIDRENGLCGVGAVQAKLPFDAAVATELKQVFRKDIYRKYHAWKGEEEQEKAK